MFYLKGTVTEYSLWALYILGTGNYTTLMWAGDQNVDFSYGDGLPSTIPSALNMGLSGIGITHFDIGGYTTYQAFGLVRTAEMLLRSAEAAVFTPMFRSHEGIAFQIVSCLRNLKLILYLWQKFT